MDIAAWLRSLGLEQYEQTFRDNAVDAAVLPELTVEDLRDLGVSLVGHPRKLLAAIAVLRSDVGSTASAPVATRLMRTSVPSSVMMIAFPAFVGLVATMVMSSVSARGMISIGGGSSGSETTSGWVRMIM